MITDADRAAADTICNPKDDPHLHSVLCKKFSAHRIEAMEEAAKVADTEARAMDVLCADASDLDVMDRYGARFRTATRIADNIRALMTKEPK